MKASETRVAVRLLQAELRRCCKPSVRSYATRPGPSKPSPPPGHSNAQGQSRPQSKRVRNIGLLVGGCALLAVPAFATSDTRNALASRSFWPFSTSSSGAPSAKLELYQHNQLSVASSAFYPAADAASDHKYLRIALPTSSESVAEPASESARLRIRSLYIKEPSLVIERAYTPLHDTFAGSTSLAAAQNASSSTDNIGAKDGSVDLLVKRYADGELSRYLHRLAPGAVVEARGPIDTWSLARDHGADAAVPDEIVLIVGGTGITPAYQLLTNVLGQPGSPPQPASQRPVFKLLYAAPDLPNSLLLPQLHALAQSNAEQLRISLFLESVPGSTTPIPSQPSFCLQSNRRSAWNPLTWLSTRAPAPAMSLTTQGSESLQIPVYESRITPAHISHILGGATSLSGAQNTLILVCGPDGMVAYLAGPKSRDGRTQGPLQGVLAHLGYTPDQVFKL